jgi:hypothetical protein
MSENKGWPDASRPGVPVNAEKDGPHLLVNKFGTREWFWWVSNGTTWMGARGGESTQSVESWTYIGPAAAPDGLPV